MAICFRDGQLHGRSVPQGKRYLKRFPPKSNALIDHDTGQVLAHVFGARKDQAFLELKALLAPFGITRFYTDGWGADRRHLDAATHTVGKQDMQKIARKHTTLRARIKRLVRKTIYFSKSIKMHDIVVGLFINRFEYGRAI